jgi:transposase InsO family protein
MPWNETDLMRERVRFIDDLESELFTMTELCARYGISRKTGYKWAQRYVEAEGCSGLVERSRAPKHCPHRLAEPVAEALLEMRREHPRWGPRKLLAVLSRRRPQLSLPAASTVGDLLRRHGLVEPRARGRRRSPPQRPKWEAATPNELWSVDFKGEFRMGDRHYCYPLTLVDRHSRYLLGCCGQRSTATLGARAALERCFREHGLPRGMLSDNGSPFSSRALAGLSRLSVEWIKLGIRPVLIEPGHPEQNGAHERMHRTLKAETARPPAANLAAQQRRFDAFRREFNELRPHEALAQRTPAQLYEPSPRPYPRVLPEIEYPGHYEVRRVRQAGEIKWQGDLLFLSSVLAGEPVGLEEVEDGIWSLCFGPLLLARFDERTRRLEGVVASPERSWQR